MKGAVVRADCIVEIHADVMQAGRNESHDRNEPGGGAGGTLGHTEPFVESVGGAGGSQSNSTRVDCSLSKPREKVEHGQNRTAAEGGKHLVDAGNRNLRNLGDLAQFLVVDGDTDATRFLGDAHEGARPRRRGVLNETGREIGVQNGVYLFGEDCIKSVGARLNRLGPWRHLDFKRA